MIKPYLALNTRNPSELLSCIAGLRRDRPFWNFLHVEDSFEMIDDSARADISQFSYDRKLAVEVDNSPLAICR